MASTPFRTVDVFLAITVLAVAGGARAWYLTACADGGNSGGPVRVQDDGPLQPKNLESGEQQTEVAALSDSLTQNHNFSVHAPFADGTEVTAHASPGLPWLLHWLDGLPLTGLSSPAKLRWLQSGLGALSALLYFYLARRIFDSSIAAFLAGLFCGLHPIWVADVAAVNDGVLASFLLALSMASGVRGVEDHSAGASLVYGVSLAGLALVRAALLPFGLAALLWYMVRARSLSRGWLLSLLAFLGFANGLAPWAMRNYQTFRDFIPVVDSAYVHLWMGNNPDATGGPMDEAAMLKAYASARDEEPGKVAEELSQLGQIQRYDLLGNEVIKQVQRDPAGALRHRLESGVCFVLGEKWLKDRAFWEKMGAQEIGPHWLLDSLPVTFNGTMLAMILLGLLGWRWSHAWPAATLPSLALIWVPLPYLLSHAEALHGPRLPIDGILLTYAALALCRLVSLGVPPANNRDAN
jgi:hypothetical protein